MKRTQIARLRGENHLVLGELRRVYQGIRKIRWPMVEIDLQTEHM